MTLYIHVHTVLTLFGETVVCVSAGTETGIGGAGWVGVTGGGEGVAVDG